MDAEARLELGNRGDRPTGVAHGSPCRLLELRAKAAEGGDRLVHELDPDARTDVDHDLPPDAEQRVRDRNREIPARPELEERRLGGRQIRSVLLVRRKMVGRAGELLAVRGVSDRERMEDVSLEDVVEALALRHRT